jgi:hypothetical protein
MPTGKQTQVTGPLPVHVPDYGVWVNNRGNPHKHRMNISGFAAGMAS